MYVDSNISAIYFIFFNNLLINLLWINLQFSIWLFSVLLMFWMKNWSSNRLFSSSERKKKNLVQTYHTYLLRTVVFFFSTADSIQCEILHSKVANLMVNTVNVDKYRQFDLFVSFKLKKGFSPLLRFPLISFV